MTLSMTDNIQIYKSSRIGTRPTNEDTEEYETNLYVNDQTKCHAYNPDHAPVDVFIICDGHGGHEVSKFVAPELRRQFMNKNLKYPLTQDVIYKIFNKIQQFLVNHPKKIANACGCTALVLVRYLDYKKLQHIQIINLGDSRAVLSRRGIAIPLTKDHKPFWSDEKKRIDTVNERTGINRQICFDSGDWRIGDLSVSRSFGDLDNTPHVTHFPELFNYQLLPADGFIVMACDGVWDVLQNHEVVNFVRDFLTKNHTEFYKISRCANGPTDINNIAQRLADYAITRGSTDNVSVIIIVFK